MNSSSKIPAKYIRGGTSKGVYINSKHLPNDKSLRDKIILKIMGSPDPTGLQIDGMGGGISSTSKVALISKSYIKDNLYLNYNFGQVSVKENKIDWTGNCGNLASGLFEFIKNYGEFEEYKDCLEKINNNDLYSHKLRVWQEKKKTRNVNMGKPHTLM